MDLQTTYFYTATILNLNKLLSDDALKNIIVESLEFLASKKKIKVYGFVVKPNHYSPHLAQS